jgi:6-phosphogluconolactonase
MKVADDINENRLIIACSFRDGKSGGLKLYQFDKSGKVFELLLQKKLPFAPIHIVFSQNRKFIYSACSHSSKSGYITAHEIDLENRTLSLINSQDSGGLTPCYVSLDLANRFLLAANYSSGTFCCYPIQDNGGLGSSIQTVHHHGQSVHPERQTEPHIHCILTDPTNYFVYAADLGADQIVTYSFNSNTGGIKKNHDRVTNLPPGSGPRHLYFHPKYPFVYLITELSNRIHCYKINDGSNLIEIQQLSTIPENKKCESFSADIAIDPLGFFLYTSNRGLDCINIFKISQIDCTLKYLTTVSAEGRYPWSLDINSTGEFLIVANKHSNNLVLFQRNLENGMLSKIAELLDVQSTVTAKFF